MDNEPICPVCKCALIDGFIACGKCETPHHNDCWEYNEGCAIYGCKKCKYRQIASVNTSVIRRSLELGRMRQNNSGFNEHQDNPNFTELAEYETYLHAYESVQLAEWTNSDNLTITAATFGAFGILLMFASVIMEIIELAHIGLASIGIAFIAIILMILQRSWAISKRNHHRRRSYRDQLAPYKRIRKLMEGGGSTDATHTERS